VNGAKDEGVGEHFNGAGAASASSPPQGQPLPVDLSAQPVPPSDGPAIQRPSTAEPGPSSTAHTVPLTFPAEPGHAADAHAGPLTLTADSGPSGDGSLAFPAEGVLSPADPRPWGVPNSGPGFVASGPAAEVPPGSWAGGPQTGPTSFADLFRAPQPPRVPHRWGLGAYLVVEVAFLLLSVVLAYLLSGRLTSSAGAIALALAVPTVGAAGLAMLITKFRGNGPRIDLGLQVTRRDVVVGLICGLAGLAVTIPASLLYVAIVGADASSAVGDAFGGVRTGPVLAIVIFLIVVFVAPVCEEIVYRGLLWGAVERLGANRWWTLVVTTVVFALAHFEFSRTPLLLVVAIPIGVARVITGRLSAGVIAHQINNLLPGVVLMLSVLGAVPMT
jgi:membrane protease YdiL (CAAX protease family)